MVPTYRSYKELQKLNAKEIKVPSNKWANEQSPQVEKKRAQVANNYF